MSTEHLSTSTSPSRTRARSRSFGRTSGPAVADARWELLAFAKERQARYKLPTEVRLIEALPRNAVGKVAKPELRERVKQ